MDYYDKKQKIVNEKLYIEELRKLDQQQLEKRKFNLKQQLVENRKLNKILIEQIAIIEDNIKYRYKNKFSDKINLTPSQIEKRKKENKIKL